MTQLVGELVARGHDVHWYAAGKFAATVEATGARFVAMRAARDWDDADIEAALPALRGRRGLARVKTQLRELFIDPIAGQLSDLAAAADDIAPDAVVADAAHLGAALLCEQRGLPLAGVGISALMLPSIDTAPFGSALPPKRASRFLNWLIFRVVFGDINRAYRRARVQIGLPGGTGTYFDVVSPQLFLQPTVPAFEYPRRDLPPQVHFIGPLVPRTASPSWQPPPWWHDIVDARRREVPIVLVTQGTLATDPRELIAPTLRALADEPVLVIATTGRVSAAWPRPFPQNARVATFIPYQVLLPYVAAVVTNGGYGGVQMALSHGVPLVVAGGSEEKPEIAARVRWSGAGVDLRTGRPSPERIRKGVRSVLADARFRDRARAIARDIADHDPPAEGASLIETLVSCRAPVKRAAVAAIAAAMIVLAGCRSFIDDQAAASTYRILQTSFEAARRQPDLQLAREAMPGGIVQLESFALAYPRHVEFQRLYAETVCQYTVAFVFDDWEDAQLAGRALEQARLAARLTTLLTVCADANLALLPANVRAAREGGSNAWSRALVSAQRTDAAPLRWLATTDAVRVAVDPLRGFAQLGSITDTMNRCAQLAPGDHDADAELVLATLAAVRSQLFGGDDGAEEFAIARNLAGPGALMVDVMYAKAIGVARRDRKLFETTLHHVLDADLSQWPDRRLGNELAKLKAARYLAAADALFSAPPPPAAERTGSADAADAGDATRAARQR
jgi:UDP:flavonoid glycosyltransferase YjiC (YdhE family)